MKKTPASILIMLMILIILNVGAAGSDSKTIRLPDNYKGTAGIKVNGVYHYLSSELEPEAATEYSYRETFDQEAQINALLGNNYLVYIPSIEKPLVTGTVEYNHHTYQNGRKIITNIAPPQNINAQNFREAVGLYLNPVKKTYTISLVLGADGESTTFDKATGEVKSRTKKRFELEKIELTLPLPRDLSVLKGRKLITGAVDTPNDSRRVLKNQKTIEVTWEFIASAESVEIPPQIIEQIEQDAK
ncbi:MAG: hypothetical protein GX075_05825 [Firmicutes bacterium]|nr:hypothetical protein [Bacillota bacterium]